MARITSNTRYSRYKQYAKGLIYHIYNRGNGKQNIFLEENDYRFYLNRLREALLKHDASLVCYALMPNHIHLVVKQENDIPIHKFISSLHTSYSMFFNKKSHRYGHLFQDRFKQVIVETDEQLLQLSKYVHLNPVAAGLAEKPWKYFWSSYQEVMGANPLSLCQKEILIDSMVSLTGIDKEDFTRKYAEFCLASPTEKEIELLTDFAIEPIEEETDII